MVETTSMVLNWGERIRRIRLNKHLTQQQIADRGGGGLTQKHVEAIENGRQKGTDAILIKALSKGLDIPYDELVRTIYGIEELSNSVFIFDKFPSQIGDEPVTIISLPQRSSKNARGYLVKGSYLEPRLHDGDYIIIDPSMPIAAGDEVLCLVDSRMQIAFLRKVVDELWLEGISFKIRYQDSPAVYKICQFVINVNKP